MAWPHLQEACQQHQQAGSDVQPTRGEKEGKTQERMTQRHQGRSAEKPSLLEGPEENSAESGGLAECCRWPLVHRPPHHFTPRPKLPVCCEKDLYACLQLYYSLLVGLPSPAEHPLFKEVVLVMNHVHFWRGLGAVRMRQMTAYLRLLFTLMALVPSFSFL